MLKIKIIRIPQLLLLHFFLFISLFFFNKGQAQTDVLTTLFPRENNCLLDASLNLQEIKEMLKPGDIILTYNKSFLGGSIRKLFKIQKLLFFPKAPKGSNYLHHTALYLGDDQVGESTSHAVGPEISARTLESHFEAKQEGEIYYLIIRPKNSEASAKAVTYFKYIMNTMERIKLENNFSFSKGFLAPFRSSTVKSEKDYIKSGLSAAEIELEKNQREEEGERSLRLFLERDLNLKGHCTEWVVRSFMAGESYQLLSTFFESQKSSLKSYLLNLYQSKRLLLDHEMKELERNSEFRKFIESKSSEINFKTRPENSTPQSLWYTTNINRQNFENICLIKASPKNSHPKK